MTAALDLEQAPLAVGSGTGHWLRPIAGDKRKTYRKTRIMNFIEKILSDYRTAIQRISCEKPCVKCYKVCVKIGSDYPSYRLR